MQSIIWNYSNIREIKSFQKILKLLKIAAQSFGQFKQEL